jgi:DtxR family Mn-dependent transcriptional regulator
MKITDTQEDYLRAIYLLSLSKGGFVKKVEIVKILGLSKSTVTQRLEDLKRKGWLAFEGYGPVNMTEKGIALAEKITYKHRIIECFLKDKLGLNDEDLHHEAHLLEHAVSDKVLAKLVIFLDNPTHCPHGSPLPDLNLD